MGRPPRNETAAREFGERLTALHQAAGKPSMRDIDKALIRLDLDLSEESLRKAHAGLIDPMKCDAELIAGLAAFYGVDLALLGEPAARRMGRLLTLVGAPTNGDRSRLE